MKLLLLFSLCLGACTTAPVSRVAPANNVATPAPERTPSELIARDVDLVAKLAGLVPLRTANSAQGDTEIRVWYGFGIFPLEGFVMKLADNQWSAFHLKVSNYSRHGSFQPNRVARIGLPPPKSGWESCWKRLVGAGVLTLPNGTHGPDPDAEGFYVEILNSGSYREYEYISPEYSETPNAKRMLAIGDIISDEFGLARFHITTQSR